MCTRVHVWEKEESVRMHDAVLRIVIPFDFVIYTRCVSTRWKWKGPKSRKYGWNKTCQSRSLVRNCVRKTRMVLIGKRCSWRRLVRFIRDTVLILSPTLLKLRIQRTSLSRLSIFSASLICHPLICSYKFRDLYITVPRTKLHASFQPLILFALNSVNSK